MAPLSSCDCPHLDCVGEVTKEELIQKSHVCNPLFCIVPFNLTPYFLQILKRSLALFNFKFFVSNQRQLQVNLCNFMLLGQGTDKDKKIIVKRPGFVLGCSLDSIEQVAGKRMLARLTFIRSNSSYLLRHHTVRPKQLLQHQTEASSVQEGALLWVVSTHSHQTI